MYRPEAKAFKKLCRKKKKECWNKFLLDSGTRDPWEIVPIAKDQFGIREMMSKLTDQDGNIAETQEELRLSLEKHHLISHNTREDNQDPRPTPQVAARPVPFREATRELFDKAYQVLTRTKNNSSPGPDRIPYRLLKLIKDTPLGVALLPDVAISTTGNVTVPEQYRDSVMVMTPKPGKDHSKIKGWRPSVLANTVGKLGEKLIAEALQYINALFHDLQYGSRKRRSAINSMMITCSRAQREVQGGPKLPYCPRTSYLHSTTSEGRN